jgi:hypothetical protein
MPLLFMVTGKENTPKVKGMNINNFTNHQNVTIFELGSLDFEQLRQVD